MNSVHENVVLNPLLPRPVAEQPLLLSGSLDGSWATSEESVRQSIFHILATQQGERPRAREFGSRIRQFVFRRLEDATLRELEGHVRACIERWEPRVAVESVVADVRAGNTAETEVLIQIRYLLLQQQSKHLITLPLRYWEHWEMPA
jgi:phage baseplate assembly protein W